jgi:hypothetical protein
MAPNPGEDSDEDVFDLAMPDHTIAAPTREAALAAIRSWVEENYKDKIHERRTQRVKLNP